MRKKTYSQVDADTTRSCTEQKDKRVFDGQGGETIDGSLTLVARDTAVDTFIGVLAATQVIGQNIQTACKLGEDQNLVVALDQLS